MGGGVARIYARVSSQAKSFSVRMLAGKLDERTNTVVGGTPDAGTRNDPTSRPT
jgi:hypothetical protein